MYAPRSSCRPPILSAVLVSLCAAPAVAQSIPQIPRQPEYLATLHRGEFAELGTSEDAVGTAFGLSRAFNHLVSEGTCEAADRTREIGAPAHAVVAALGRVSRRYPQTVMAGGLLGSSHPAWSTLVVWVGGAGCDAPEVQQVWLNTVRYVLWLDGEGASEREEARRRRQADPARRARQTEFLNALREKESWVMACSGEYADRGYCACMANEVDRVRTHLDDTVRAGLAERFMHHVRAVLRGGSGPGAADTLWLGTVMCGRSVEFDAAVPAEYFANFRGSYRCPHGETGVEIRLRRGDGPARAAGEVRMFRVDDNPRVGEGRYTVTGSLRPDGTLLLEPGQWRGRAPRGHAMLPAAVLVSEDGRSLTGRVLAGGWRDVRIAIGGGVLARGCGALEATRR